MGSAQRLLDLLRSRKPGNHLDWSGIRERIHAQFEVADTGADRVLLLDIFMATMGDLERHLSGRDLTTFRDTWAKDYELLLMKEAHVGKTFSAAKVRELIAREIAAGRMPENYQWRSSVE